MNINRFKQLLESTMGNVKPLIVEDDPTNDPTDEQIGSDEGFDVKDEKHNYDGGYSGTYTGHRLHDQFSGKGTFTNQYGRKFSGEWQDFAGGDIFKKSDNNDNLDLIGYPVQTLVRLKPGQKVDSSVCETPQDYQWEDWVLPNDKIYEYAVDEIGFCFWAKNKKNGKVFNLTKLAETNPKYQKSIDILDRAFPDLKGRFGVGWKDYFELSNSGTSGDDGDMSTNQSENSPCPYGMGKLATEEEINKIMSGEKVEVFSQSQTNPMVASNSSTGPDNFSGILGPEGNRFGSTVWKCERNNEITYFFQPKKSSGSSSDSGSSGSTLGQTGGEDLKLTDAEYIKLTS